MLASILMPYPVAVASMLYVNVWAGTSESVALAVKVIKVFSSPDCAPIAASTGLELTSLTVIVIVSVSVKVPAPLSVRDCFF